jgi:hypothetical protein
VSRDDVVAAYFGTRADLRDPGMRDPDKRGGAA